jgi:hypothetical protein
MAVSTNDIQVTWSSANYKSVSSSSSENSDDISFSASAISGEIMLKADNGGTAADGDTVDFYLQRKDDPDNDSTMDYESDGMFLAQLDTYDSDPKVKVVSIPVGITSGRLHVENNASSNSITVSATITEKTVS